jgi:Protein of unknown function (DUF3754)
VTAAASPDAARERAIAVHKSDLIEALLGKGKLVAETDRNSFRELCRRIAAIAHQETFAELERLREDYFYFDPEIEPHAGLDRAALAAAYADLLASLESVLAEANFVELTHAEIAAAHRTRPALRVDTTAPLDEFRAVRFFRRGHHEETLESTGWLGLRPRSVPVLVYDDVVLIVAVEPADGLSAHDKKRLARGRLRPGSVLIKYFRNVAAIDLNALLPNVRVVLSLRDKLLLSGPALAGGLPILIKLASTITILFLVIGFYFGLSANVRQEEIAGALAALSGLVGLGGFIGRQWLRYQRQSLKYQKELTENIYYRNINNNAGIFDAMIAAAEDQECKEAMLAFYFLLISADACAPATLARDIEGFLGERFHIAVAFKAEEALGRLERLGLARREGGRWSALPMEQALAALGRLWSALGSA